MRAKAIAGVLALGAMVIVALPGAASAHAAAHGPATRGIGRSVYESFDLHGTNGFLVGVEVLDRRSLKFSVSKPGSGLGFTQTTYSIPYRQPAGSDHIKARIGGLGRIDVRFVPESVKEEPPFRSECHGGKTVLEEGQFVGQISFHGERGYTRVRARHAGGFITKSPHLICIESPCQSPRSPRSPRRSWKKNSPNWKRKPSN